ncbi:MAG: hypothetical protein JSU74_10595 [Candidatus Zixiibacteriota bacterium]|nr:MAG: hypothetical protein JSU74_10595 [candidate division Zixibacteria bacterium]
MTPSDNIVYNSRAWTVLSRSFQQGRAANTYLLFGPDGTGRWLLAVSYAALINCESIERFGDDGGHAVPCGKCRNCRNIFGLRFEGIHVAAPIPPHENKLDNAIDFTNEFLDTKRAEPFSIPGSAASTNIPVALARDIRKRLSLKSTEGVRRVVIFYQMEKMLAASADALLKIIEEPPSDTTIMLITRNPDTLLPTIQSRAQRIKVDLYPPDTIEKYLIEKYDLSERRAKLLARISEGSIGRAVDAIESPDEDEISKRGVAFLIFKSLFVDARADTLAHMNEVLNFRDRGEAEEILRLWQLLIRDCASVAITDDDKDIVNVDFAPEIKKLSGYFGNPHLPACMVEDIKNALADMRLNVHIQGALMALVLRLKTHIAAPN